MKQLTRIVSILCLIAMLLTAFAACKKKQVETPQETEPEETKFDYSNGDRLDTSLDYGNEKFTIMGWDTQQVTEWVTEITEESTEIDKVLYNNLSSVEERLAIDVDIKTVPGR